MSVGLVLQRKLKYLGYPASDSFSIHSEDDIAKLMIWLEDRVIRILPIASRFRDSDSKNWPTFVDSYLKKLNCPFGLSEPQPMVDWILNRGIESQSSLAPKSGPMNTKDDSHPRLYHDIFANIDTESAEFKHGVENLAKLLEIPQHPDPKQSFRAACLLIEKMLSHENIEMSKKEYEKEVDLLKTEDVPLGFDVSDPVLRSVVLTLRLLHVSELRQLQDQINCAIVQVQQITADPKTDEKLGQVGF